LHVLLIEAIGSAALFFTALLLLGVARLRRQAPSPPSSWPAIAILRPCEGAEPDLMLNLLSSLRARYAGPRRVLFLVPDEEDAAYPIVRTVLAAAHEAGLEPAELVLTRPQPRQNRKVAQLRAGLLCCTEPVVVTVDSDVCLGDADLPALITALGGPPAGARSRGRPIAAAFASPVEVVPQTRWDRASVALVGGSAQNFMALYGLYHLYGGVPSMAGALCALHREPLLSCGGFDGVLTYLGEDYELARRLTGLGYHIALSREHARCTDGGRSAAAVIARVGRWLTVVRAQRPLLLLTYPLFMATTPALLLAALALRTPGIWALSLLLLAARALLCYRLRQAQRVPRGPLAAVAEVLAAEVLLWLGLGRALLSRRVSWRGHRFRIGRGGTMIPEPLAAGVVAQRPASSAAPQAIASSGATPRSGLATRSSLTNRPSSGSSAPPPERRTA
jgi:ceramide glucosyltransferase